MDQGLDFGRSSTENHAIPRLLRQLLAACARFKTSIQREEAPTEGDNNLVDPKLAESIDGLNLMVLLLQSQDWLHRRVDALRLDPDGTTRRYVSVDLTMDDSLAISSHSKNRVIVPLGVMRKGAIRRLDAKQDSKGIIVLGQEQNSALAKSMLAAGLGTLPQKCLDRPSSTLLDSILDALVSPESGSEPQALENYNKWKAEHLDLKGLDSDHKLRLALIDALARRFTDHYLFLVEIDSALLGTRTTLKYSLDQTMPDSEKDGLHQIRFHYALPDFGFAKSQHMELEIPRGLTLIEMDFLAFDQKGIVRQISTDKPSDGNRMGHTVLAPKDPVYEAEVWATVAPSKQGIYTFSKWASIITAGLVVLSVAVRLFDTEFLRIEAIVPSPAASIILIAPALLLSWIGREPEHELVAALLQPLRTIVFSCAGVLVAMAALAAIPLSPIIWNVVWIGVYIGTLAIVVYAIRVFWAYGRMSVPSHTVGTRKGETK